MMIGLENADRMLDQLEMLGQKLGISIRYELLRVETNGDSNTARGGLCRLRDMNLVLVDSRLCAVERCRVLAEALGAFDLSRIFVPPAVRDLIDAYRKPDSSDLNC